MMREEFEQLTGIYVTNDLYRMVNAAYYNFGGEKQEFCKAYKENKDGLASTVQRAANMENLKRTQEHDDEVKALQEELNRLKRKLDAEQEWRTYVDERHVSQWDYENLKKGHEPMNDDAAKDWIHHEFGFDPSRLKIIREVDEQEINRHNQLRPTGRKIAREPYYEATDYYYIRFDCSGLSWEAWNGSLTAY